MKASLGRCLSSLISQHSQTNLQLATTLDFWQKQYDLRPDVPGQALELLDGVDLGALSFQQAVMDSAPLNTRAGLYIFLNAMVPVNHSHDFLCASLTVGLFSYMNVQFLTII